VQKVELLAPAGNLEKLQIAVTYGADAVYLGGKEYGLRAAAGNFTLEEMKAGVDFAHAHQAKVYVTVNIFAHNVDLEQLADYLYNLEKIGIDAIIISDPGVWLIAQEINSGLDIHISTQANVTNWASCAFWEQHGAKGLSWPGNCPWRKSRRSAGKPKWSWRFLFTEPCVFLIRAGVC